MGIMVNLTRIYTKTGDKGMTSLGNGSRVEKFHPLIEAYSTVDEANSHIGLIRARGKIGDGGQAVLERIQNDLFDVGADLCKPFISINDTKDIRVSKEQVDYLELQIDAYNMTLEPLRSFVIPGGNETSALFHIVRTVVRRAEREAWKAREGRYINDFVMQYLNRLSDLMFVMARFYNENEHLWQPAKSQGIKEGS
jgi:cob(I)alamin adenosyltransferase